MCSELFWKRPHIAEMMVLVQQLSFLLMLSAHKWALTHKCNSHQILGLGFLFYGPFQKHLPATPNLCLSLQSNPQLVNLWVMWDFASLWDKSSHCQGQKAHSDGCVLLWASFPPSAHWCSSLCSGVPHTQVTMVFLSLSFSSKVLNSAFPSPDFHSTSLWAPQPSLRSQAGQGACVFQALAAWHSAAHLH